MIIVLLGPPGSGKGSQAERISKEYDFMTISMGSLFRKAIENEDNIGKEVKSYLAKGHLVPDEIVFKVIEREFSKIEEGKGIVFDGFPRNIKQAKSLDRFLGSKEMGVDLALYFDVPFSIISERLENRKICPHCGSIYNVKTSPPEIPNICDKCGFPLEKREDDRREVIEDRFKVYKEETMPVKEIYKDEGILVNVENDRSEDKIWEEVKSKIDEELMQKKEEVKGGR